MAKTQDTRRAARLGLILNTGLLFSSGSAAAAALPVQEPSGPPTIESESAIDITAADATLNAQINPGGLETSYQFRLESGCPVSGLSCMAITVYPLPAGSVPASPEAQSVSLDLNAAGVTLHPGTAYRYGVEATNAAGPTVTGPDQTFTTESTPPLPVTEPPSIDSESATGVTETDAIVGAEINPSGADTAYEFQIYTHSSYGYTRPACPLETCEAIIVGESLPRGLVEPLPESIPASFVGQLVSLDLASIGADLQPDTTYRYRVLASSAGGPLVTGPDQTFSTASQPGPIPLGLQSRFDASHPSSALPSPAAALSAPQRRRHRRHKGGLHRNFLHRLAKKG